jgi:tetratricopeptide (TPR) repeat protein
MASDSKAKILREGERYVQQGKINLAINEYLKIIRIDPEDVLILNTVGDLYLRQGRVEDANGIFLQVAESYTHNSFLLKAIAVYKKILNTNPHNLEVNALLASLYARQGMNVDARSQYIALAELCAGEGRLPESLDAYEKVVEIDPMNYQIQLKLAETYQGQGFKEKAYPFFVAAARAQVKTGDIPAAMAAFRRAFALNPANPEALKGLLETALQTPDIRAILDQLAESVSAIPEDPALQELLGRSYLAARKPDLAEQHLRRAVDADESRHDQFFPLSLAFLESGNPDHALHCLDPILPILISRRETERIVEAYRQILTADPSHMATLQKLAEIHSATNDDPRYVAVLEKLAQLYQTAGDAGAALEAIEKILVINPTGEKHLQMHRELFEQANPDIPYRLPRAVLEAAERDALPNQEGADSAAAVEIPDEDSSNSAIVEVDLLLNYGMKEKALQLLRSLETKSPRNKDVRQRLITLYREAGEQRLAAEQCILLSALYQKSRNTDAAQKSLSEARKLAPDWVGADLDVIAFALERGINLESAKAEGSTKDTGSSLEVDLSGDLSEIFFQNAQGEPDLDAGAATPALDATVDEFPQGLPRPPAPESIEEQLQEVDFYIRLGFHDEARAKLDEIATAHAGHPELALRYEQLGQESCQSPDAPGEKSPAAESHSSVLEMPEALPIALPAAISTGPAQPAARARGTEVRDTEDADDDRHFSENKWFEIDMERPEHLPVKNDIRAMPPAAARATPPGQPAGEAPANFMFADLIDEVNALTDREIAREDFETHFSLGIAFREMGLTEDAIKEFQSAVKALSPEKSSKELIQCCGMLSTCFLEKGMPRSAIRWCQTGLGIREISSHEAIALRYDMGIAHSSAGESNRALECFGMIFGVDPSYRDVAQRIDDLKSGMERHVP